MSEQDRYDAEQMAKVKVVVSAALQNRICQQDVELSTSGCDPSARARIPAYILAKFLKINPKD